MIFVDLLEEGRGRRQGALVEDLARRLCRAHRRLRESISELGYAVERASRPTILIYALIGAALALLVSGLTLDFGETPISMSVVGVVVILLAVLCLTF